MSPVYSLFSDDQPPPKRSRVEAESTSAPSYLHQTNLTLSSLAAQSEKGHFAHVPHGDDSIGVNVIVEEEQKEDAMELSSVNRVSHGSVSLIGRRRVMEDAITVAPPGLPSYCRHVFFAVYGGQGGPWVSVACHERLHLILADEILREGVESGVDWKKVMKASFKKMDDVVKGFVSGNDHGLVDDGLGSTATVVMVGEKEIVVANCGDSRAVLFSAGVALPLSMDHKPHVPSERMRLENGGFDVHFELPVSRYIGHHSHVVVKQYVTADPDVNVQQRTKSDEFLIIATNGLWDVVSNEDACVVVKNCLNGQIKRSFEEVPVTSPIVAATTLAEFAMARGSKDNISLVVVEL